MDNSIDRGLEIKLLDQLTTDPNLPHNYSKTTYPFKIPNSQILATTQIWCWINAYTLFPDSLNQKDLAY